MPEPNDLVPAPNDLVPAPNDLVPAPNDLAAKGPESSVSGFTGLGRPKTKR